MVLLTLVPPPTAVSGLHSWDIAGATLSSASRPRTGSTPRRGGTGMAGGGERTETMKGKDTLQRGFGSFAICFGLPIL
jgi:hypothetical protein